jgi:hypothetical protein
VQGAGGGTGDTGIFTVSVANAPLSATAFSLQTNEGSPTGSIPMAIFTDENPLASSGAFTASIDWGDGSAPDVGSISYTGYDFMVSAPDHTYFHAGNKTLTVTINCAGGGSVSTNPVATVQNQSLSASNDTTNATEGPNGAGAVVGHFNDSNSYATADDFSADIDWGNGLHTAGAVVPSGNGGADFYVVAYDVPVDSNASVITTINGAGGGSVQSQYYVAVTDAALNASGSDFNTTQNQDVGNVVASFTDNNTNSPPDSDFSANIYWGDGYSSAGTIQSNGSGGWNVLGDHAYSGTGTYSVATSIYDVGGSTASANSTATVFAPYSVTPYDQSMTEGDSSGLLTLGTIVDPNPSATPSEYSAIVYWGDGTSATAAIDYDGNGGFSVSASRFAAHAGTTTFTLQINGPGGSTSASASFHRQIPRHERRGGTHGRDREFFRQ